MNNSTPPDSKPPVSGAGRSATRTPLTPAAIKQLATIEPSDIKLMLQQARKDNPVLYSLLIAIPNAKP